MLLQLAWKNIWFKPLNTMLSIILLASSVAIVTVLILLQKQFEDKFSSTINGVDLVLGAKGSPTQLILSSVYHIDNPTGNINYDSVKRWMNHPFIEKAIPLAFGDNYKGFKIVGTNEDYLKKYKAVISSGKLFEKNFEVVVGSQVALKLNLKLGDTFFGSHGDSSEGEVHEQYAYKISGIVAQTGGIIDNLILSNIPSVWQMHEDEDMHEHETNEISNPSHYHDDEEPAHDEGHHEHEASHEHEHHHEDDLTLDAPNKEITAVLLKFRNKMGVVLWPRIIAQNTDMQAASPAIEVNRIFSLFGIGFQALRFLAYAIMLISGISIFITLYSRLKERSYEFALLRINGATRTQLLSLITFESLFLCGVGFFVGTFLGRLGLGLISYTTEGDLKIAFNPFDIIWNQEVPLFLTILFIGILAAGIPAAKAYHLNIAKTLANA
jgi:putative ABC transport system permease protein